MPTSEQQPIVIKDNDGQAHTGALHLKAYDKHERIKRAVTAWVICWILAVLSLPILGAHWFLVPGFLIAGPVMAYRRYHAETTTEKATGECPACQSQITIPLEAKEHPELWKYCPNCNSPLHILDQEDLASDH